MDVAETARKALEILDRDGWCKGSVTWMEKRIVMHPGEKEKADYPSGSHCLGGAWNLALHGNPFFQEDLEQYQPLIRLILDQYPQITELFSDDKIDHGIITWVNDRKETTEADIRAILEKLAAHEMG